MADFIQLDVRRIFGGGVPVSLTRQVTVNLAHVAYVEWNADQANNAKVFVAAGPVWLVEDEAQIEALAERLHR